MPGIQAYRGAVDDDTRGRVVSSADGGRLKPRNATMPGKLWIKLTRASSRETQNTRTVKDFVSALRGAYGEGIGQKIVAGHGLERLETAGGPLTKAKVRGALLQATYLKEVADLRLQKTPVALKGAVESAVSWAMEGVQTPDPQRARIYHDFLVDAVYGVAPQILAVDGTDDGSLLARVAGEIAKKLDRHVLEAVFKHLKDIGQFPSDLPGDKQTGDYRKSMRTLLKDGGFTVLEKKYPGLARILRSESEQLAVSLAEIATNVRTDLADVKTSFFDDAHPAPKGLTDIKLTASDPHRDGRRVAILTLDGGAAPGDRKVVYKPRDIRIDAKLLGAGNSADIGLSMAEKLDGLLDAPMPTYKFLAKSVTESVAGGGGKIHHHGYVQHLSFGTEADNHLSEPETVAFYQSFGRQAAMLLLFGVRDLHQTNIFVSGKKPYFTDLELSLDEGVLDHVAKGKREAPDRSQIDMALTRHGERVRVPRVALEDGKLTVQRLMPTLKVIENLVISGDSSSHDPAFRARYGAALNAGFAEVIDRLGTAITANQFKVTEFMGEFRGMHTRYHPISTGENLAIIEGVSIEGLALSPEEIETKNGKAFDRCADLRQGKVTHLAKLRDAYIGDWAKRGVPYFTRILGSKEVLHDAVDAVEISREAGLANTDYFTTDPLEAVKGILTKLGTDADFRGKLKAMGKYLEGIMAPSIQPAPGTAAPVPEPLEPAAPEPDPRTGTGEIDGEGDSG